MYVGMHEGLKIPSSWVRFPPWLQNHPEESIMEVLSGTLLLTLVDAGWY